MSSNQGKTYTKALEEILCLGIDLELASLVLREVESRNFGHVLILSLTLLFLKLEGDTTDRTPLDTLHQMCGVTGNLLIYMSEGDSSPQIPSSSYLVAETLGSNDCDLIADSLVGLEIEGQLWVVSFNDDLGGLLNSLGTNATHDCGIEIEIVVEVGDVVALGSIRFRFKVGAKELSLVVSSLKQA
jgi:hypothetical protein